MLRVQKDPPHGFRCVESVCEEKLPVNATHKNCLKMKGVLQKISVHSTPEYCALPLEITPHGQNG